MKLQRKSSATRVRLYRPWNPWGYAAARLEQRLAAQIDALDLPDGARVLDFGCGFKQYRPLFPAGVDYVGADIADNASADILINDDGVDLPDNSVDVVFSTQVLEHVPDPHAYLAEARRVLRPGGWMILSTHGVMYHHPHPTDLWRWTQEGLEKMTRAHGFEPVSVTSMFSAIPLALFLVMVNVHDKLPIGLKQVFALFFNALIRLTDRRDRDTYKVHLNYFVRAQLVEQPAID